MARMGTAALAGTAVAILGIGFGLGIWLAGGAGPRETVVQVVEKPGPAAAPRAEPSAPAPPPAPAAATPSSPAAVPPAALDAVRSALASVPAVPVPKGTGVIKGRIQREDGQPLAGAEVTLQPEAPRGSFRNWVPGRDEEPDLETLVADAVARTRWSRESRKRAVTDVVGEFLFDGLADANHGVSARLKGWEIRPREWNLAARARPGAVIEMFAAPVVEVTVEVVLPDGTAPPQAMVQFAQGSGSTGTSWTTENPTARIKPGTYRVFATTGDWGQEQLKSDEQAVVLAADAPPPALRLVLRGRPGIRGKVSFEGMALEGNLMVRCARIPGDAKADPATLQGSTAQTTWAQSANGFSYSFQDLAAGRYLLGVSLSHQGKAVAWEEVAVAGEPAAKDLRVGTLDPEEFLVVRALGPDGAPLPGLQFRTGFRSGGSSSSGGGMALRRNDGAWLVPHQERGGPAKEGEEATWWVEAVSPAHGTKRAEYAKGQTQEIVLRFEDPGTVDLAATGYRGSALEGTLQVSLQMVEGGSTRSRSFGGPPQRLDAEGRTTVLGVQPGEYEVLVYSGDNMMRALARIPVSVRAGRNAISFPVPTVYSVSVSGAEGNASLRKKDDNYWNDSRRPDAEGRVVFDGLPEGDYTVQSGAKRQEFHLPGTSEVRL